MNIDGERLKALRLAGDPVVDDLVRKHAGRSPEMLGELAAQLFRSARLPVDHPLVAEYLRIVPRVDLGDRVLLARGQALFALWGPEILLTLGCYSLPLVYAAAHGVQTIYRTRRLKRDAFRRICDTAQMVLNCMQPGELEEGGLGWWAARKVRLIHSLARLQLLTDRRDRWSMVWGLPINQDDQATTLLTFSVAALDGLRKMGAEIRQEDADAYVSAWSSIGRLLGVEESLLLADEAGAISFARQLAKRQYRATAEGKYLNDQLLVAMDTLFPVKGYSLALTDFFLTDNSFGADVKTMLQLPEPSWMSWVIRTRAASAKLVFPLLDVIPGAADRRRFIASRFAQKLLLQIRPDAEAPFDLAERLLVRWGV